MIQMLQLVPALFRFAGARVIRSRKTYFACLLILVGFVGTLSAVLGGNVESEGPQIVFILGFWAIAGPLCRPWLDEEVREGYAGLWLQKPIRPLAFYTAQLVAMVVWSILAALAVCVVALPVLALYGSASDVRYLAVGGAWIPPLLVVLSFLGSGLGARNGGLFAYGLLLAGFGLRGVASSLALGPIHGLLTIILPPAWAVLEVSGAMRTIEPLAALLRLWPMMVYGLVCAVLGLSLALRVPSRLARAG